MFRIFTTEEFDKDFQRLDKAEQMRIENVLRQLKEQGGLVGKPLGAPLFKEKKFNGKRLYFLVYDTLSVIFVIAISDKKAQQATINRILLYLAEYQKYIYETLKEKSLL